jgi:hypothetical protein
LGDGARSDLLCWITHARPKTTSFNDYVTLVWNPLCEEVAKLKVHMRRPLERIAAVANYAEPLPPARSGVTGAVTGAANALEMRVILSARRGTRTPTSFDTRT